MCKFLLVFKVIKTGKLAHLAGMAVRGWGGPTVRAPNYHLHISRAGCIYRGAKFFIRLPRILEEESGTGVFKAQMKNWVRRNISNKPS